MGVMFEDLAICDEDGDDNVSVCELCVDMAVLYAVMD